MKYLQWFKDNINLISFTTGLILVVSGKADIGLSLMSQGAS